MIKEEGNKCSTSLISSIGQANMEASLDSSTSRPPSKSSKSMAEVGDKVSATDAAGYLTRRRGAKRILTN